MDSLKHSIFFADVGTACGAYAALELGSFIGNNITVKVRKNKYLEISAALLVNKLCSGDINVPVIGDDFGVLLANLLAYL